jgi:hypothetical protein
MATKFPKLELEEVFQREATEILEARKRGQVIHRTKDVDTAGAEVEHAVRGFLKRKLPQLYHVGHGHIMDTFGKVSRQLDVVIADNAEAPVLFEAKDGTQYFPYESVYAIGEIRTSYTKTKKPIHEFAEKTKDLKDRLTRDSVNRLQSGGYLTSSFQPKGHAYGSSNPLFTFLLFVEGGKFSANDIKELYLNSTSLNLPNLVCLLDKGVILLRKEVEWANGQQNSFYSIHPGFSNEMNLVGHSRQSGNWYFTEFGNAKNRAGANLGFLYSIISSFLTGCSLGTPNMSAYLEHILKVSSSEKISEDPLPKSITYESLRSHS